MATNSVSSSSSASAVAQIVTAVQARAAAAADGQRVLIGIAGAPGVGKSTVAGVVATALDGVGLPAVVLPMDGFHLPQARLVELGRRERMGAPDTFDVRGFAGVLGELRAGGSSGADERAVVRAPLFDRDTEEALPDALAIGPDIRVVLVDGNYLLLDTEGWADVAPLLDATVLLTLDDATRQARLIARHIRFGKSPDAAAAWALGPDERNAALIHASAPRADLVVALD